VAGSKAQSVALPPEASSPPNTFRLYALVGLMVALWSLTFIVAKLALREIPPLALPGLRFAIATVGMLPLLAWDRRRSAPVPMTFRDWTKLALLALLGLTCSQIFYAVALKSTSIAHGSLIMSLTPLTALLTAIFIGQERFAVLKALGMVVAFAGVALLQTGKADTGVATWQGDAAAAICGASFGIFTVLSKPLTERLGSLAMNTYSHVVATLSLVPFTLAAGVEWSKISAGAWWGVVYMGLAGNVVGYLIYGYALERLPSSKLSMYAYVQPVLATVFAFLILSEPVTWTMAAAGALILAGVWIAGRRA
jgi:drug/metabolite transporter (DMT)-like permease